MPALALTDHDGLYGAVRFMQAAKAYPIKPIIGAEISLSADEVGLSSTHSHLVLLAKDRAGYANLCRIVTRAQLDHQDDPHLSLDELAPYTGGLVALSGCRRGEIPTLLLRGEYGRRLKLPENMPAFLATTSGSSWSIIFCPTMRHWSKH